MKMWPLWCVDIKLCKLPSSCWMIYHSILSTIIDYRRWSSLIRDQHDYFVLVFECENGQKTITVSSSTLPSSNRLRSFGERGTFLESGYPTYSLTYILLYTDCLLSLKFQFPFTVTTLHLRQVSTRVMRTNKSLPTSTLAFTSTSTGCKTLHQSFHKSSKRGTIFVDQLARSTKKLTAKKWPHHRRHKT